MENEGSLLGSLPHSQMPAIEPFAEPVYSGR